MLSLLEQQGALRRTLNMMSTSENVLENLLEDLHLLLLQFTHYIRPIGQTFRQGSCSARTTHTDLKLKHAESSKYYNYIDAWCVTCLLLMGGGLGWGRTPWCTIPLLDDTQGLKLQLHIFLHHHRAKYLKVICGQHRLEHSLGKPGEE